MLDSGPCHTCPLATGILLTPNGAHHACKPEDWSLCNLLYLTSKATQIEKRHRRFPSGWAIVRKTRTVVRLFRRSMARRASRSTNN